MKYACAEYKRSVNTCIEKCKFPEEIKCGEITPCHEGDEETAKEDNRPISILPCLSKIFERVLYDQINDFTQNIFFKHLCGFRRKYSIQHAILYLLQKWQKC